MATSTILVTGATGKTGRRIVERLADTQHEVYASELELTHPEWGFQGHPDRVGLVAGKLAVVDWKYTDGPDLKGGRYQLAAYKLLVEASPRGWKIDEVYLVQLSPTGKGYRMHRLTDVNAEQVAQAAVIVWRAREER